MWENENEKQITLKIVESLAGNNLQSKVIENHLKYRIAIESKYINVSVQMHLNK